MCWAAKRSPTPARLTRAGGARTTREGQLVKAPRPRCRTGQRAEDAPEPSDVCRPARPLKGSGDSEAESEQRSPPERSERELESSAESRMRDAGSKGDWLRSNRPARLRLRRPKARRPSGRGRAQASKASDEGAAQARAEEARALERAKADGESVKGQLERPESRRGDAGCAGGLGAMPATERARGGTIRAGCRPGTGGRGRCARGIRTQVDGCGRHGPRTCVASTTRSETQAAVQEAEAWATLDQTKSTLEMARQAATTAQQAAQATQAMPSNPPALRTAQKTRPPPDESERKPQQSSRTLGCTGRRSGH